MKNNFILYLIIFIFISSCSGMGLKRSEKSDEFLIEKKNPLVMPPDIDDLPKPSKNVESETDESFKEIISSKKIKNQNSISQSDSSLSESLLKKIEE
tara:strand:+ start:417 stop:707 length:291 start_codon:yes stop_codon:yes gene_type:complete